MPVDASVPNSPEPASPARLTLRRRLRRRLDLAYPRTVRVLLLVYAIYAAVAFGVNFFSKRAGLDISLCAFKEFTGHPCATCGGTRAAVRLAQLDLVGAIEYNPLATVALLGIAAWIVVAFVRAGRPLIRWTNARRTAMAACVVAAMLINWVYVWRAEPRLTARDQAAHPRQSDQPRPFSIPR